MLAKMIADDQHNWDLYLPKALLAYRTSIHDVTGFTPYRLVFGQSPQLPIDVMTGHVDSNKSQSYPPICKTDTWVPEECIHYGPATIGSTASA